MNNNNFISIILLIFVSLGFSACSKDSDPDHNPINSGDITMKVNGELWSSSINTLFTEEHEEEKYGVYHLVSIMGSQITDKNSKTEDDIAESITLYIAIPDSKFTNPKGIYPVVWQSSSKLNECTAIFGTATSLRDADMYVPFESGQLGTVEISGFEIGDQNVMGFPTGTQGYTKLSGSFKMDLRPSKATESSKSLKLTEGTFNLSGGMGFAH